MSARSVYTAPFARALASLVLIPALVLALLAHTAPALAVPEVDHVHLELSALRLNVNNYSLKHQVKAVATITAEDESRFSGVDLALLTISNPAGESVTLSHYKYVFNEKKFKAANAILLFKAVEDSVAPMPSELSNVPAGFFSADGPYSVVLTLRGEYISGGFSFGEPLAMSVTQSGEPVGNFCIAAEQGFEVATTPAEFGPVYYKRQDLTNFVYQLANMDQSLETGDYHTPVESPRYVFQVRAGDNTGGVTRLIDPQRYIAGYEPHLIRSELTATPLGFAAGEFAPGEVVVIDFLREDIPAPDSVFAAQACSLSSHVTIQDRVVFALHVETAPTPEELGIDSNAPLADSHGNTTDTAQ